jgi:hypothetical protein
VCPHHYQNFLPLSDRPPTAASCLIAADFVRCSSMESQGFAVVARYMTGTLIVRIAL